MFEKLFLSAKAQQRHQEGPFAAERERYLQHCSDTGATYWSMRIKCNELLWAARLLDADAKNGIDMAELEVIFNRRIIFQNAATTKPRFIAAVRPWLRFLGWLMLPSIFVALRRSVRRPICIDSPSIVARIVWGSNSPMLNAIVDDCKRRSNPLPQQGLLDVM